MMVTKGKGMNKQFKGIEMHNILEIFALEWFKKFWYLKVWVELSGKLLHSNISNNTEYIKQMIITTIPSSDWNILGTEPCSRLR